MKRRWTFKTLLFLRIIIYLGIASIVFSIYPSQSLFSYTALSIPPMLKMNYGSQSLAMGGAAVALTNNLYYMDSNPAGGMFLKVYRFSLLHQEWIYDTNYESFRASIGFKKFYIGAGFNYLYTPFQYYDYYGVRSNKTYNISQYLGILNFGYNIERYNISLGANLKYYSYNVPDSLYENQSYSIISGDLGFMLKTNIWKRFVGYQPSLVFGFNMKNIGYSKVLYNAPIEILTGISYRYSKDLLFSFEADIPFYEPVNFSLGAEYCLYDKYFIDAGIKIKENPMLSVGFGYRKKDFRLRVSYSPMIRFYNMLNISLSYSYGETKAEKIREKVERLLLEAIEYFAKEEYEKSLEIVGRILDIDPENYRAKRLYRIILKQLEVKKKLKEIEERING